MSSNNLEIKNEIHEDNSTKLSLSTSFTISFEDEDENSLKQKKKKANNVFVRRHIRNHSLPLDNTDGKRSNSQTSITKVKKSNDKESYSSISEENECTYDDDLCEAAKLVNEHIDIHNIINEITNDNQCDSSDSEGGTYTLDKNNEEVKIARKTIDQVFGISSIESKLEKTDIEEKKVCKSRMVGEWIEQSDMLLQKKTSPYVKKNSLAQSTMNLRQKSFVSRISSPVFNRQSATSIVKSNGHNSGTVICQDEVIDSTKKSFLMNSPVGTNNDTESYLKETENIVTALHNRVYHRNDIQFRQTKSAMPINNTRFNRTFSLRRDRLNTPSSNSVMKNTANAVKNNSSNMKISTNGILTSNNAKYARCGNYYKSTIKTAQHNMVIAKNKTSMKIVDVKKKVNSRLKSSHNNNDNNSGVRSASSLSSQEIEFQNWKRRKNYDPLKAAAEDRKKKSMMQSSASSASVSTATLATKKRYSTILNESRKIPVETSSSITRSASFHGLRHQNDMNKTTKSMFSETRTLTNENRESSGCIRIANSDVVRRNGSVSTASISDRKSVIQNNKMLISDPGINSGNSSGGGNDGDYIWEMPKPPSTSLQNTPPESLCSVSLLSNTMSNSSVLLSTSSNTKVNLLTLLNVTQLSHEVRNEITSFNNESKSNGINGKFTKEDIVEEQSKSDNRNDDDDNSEDRSLENYDKVDYSDDDSEWGELSGNYQLKLILNNLKEIQNFLQKLHLHC